MADDIPFERSFDAPAGDLQDISPLVRRMVAGNAGPFTFTGTCTYVVGRGEVAVIDPGPDEPAHVAALLRALEGERVKQIVITHTHRDHSPAARAVQEATGAPVVGCAPHRASRPLAAGEAKRLDASADRVYEPDRILGEGDRVEGDGWTLAALETPGHTANHLAFALEEERALFSGDHVMAWSTTIVAPPDGSMGDYMASLAKLQGRDDRVYWPGHGGPVTNPARFVRALIHHRRQREASILDRVAAGDGLISAIVPKLYEGLQPALHGAAALSVFAHLEDLVRRGAVATEGAPSLAGRYWLP
ncbi:MBL fold metallo-hydrolase [Alsobacter soli]|uniref:MBL fold metallo-hydrolase n=1 Tax=Alsobacter soli TaxID=2109933 RepID=A0A2T1HSQ5_9HYPH|nr:MBL fold metallo-hydrolase [Alsobacter soli]PSC04693.1 MBL fold metallo-hydrolase [Alsobacter soli]